MTTIEDDPPYYISNPLAENNTAFIHLGFILSLLAVQCLPL